MAADEGLLAAVREHLTTRNGIEEKPMIGGIGFMWRGRLLCGVRAEDLVVPVARDDYNGFIGDEGAKPMVMAGKSGRSWILVKKSVVSRKPAMEEWLDRAIEFVSSLPAK